MNKTQIPNDKLQQDIAFLLKRAMKAGYWSSETKDRDVGMSSNSIVAIAYGAPLKNQVLPADKSDFAACEAMWEQLPPHRKTFTAKQAMACACNAINAAV
jgi:hypothetical protein